MSNVFNHMIESEQRNKKNESHTLTTSDYYLPISVTNSHDQKSHGGGMLMKLQGTSKD